MTRLLRAPAFLAFFLTALLLPASAAAAASGDVVRQLDIDIVVRPDGVLEVTETYDWDFGTRRGLGLTRTLDARFDYPPQPGKVRVYEYGSFSAASPSGAPAGVWAYDEGPRVRVDVGAPDGSDDRRSGHQTYVLRYTVDGALNAIRNHPDVPDQDELYWNATGHDWQVPIEKATVTVTGPVDVVDHACYRGDHGSTAGCDTLDVDGREVRATSGPLPPGSGVTVMAAYPAGTFGDLAPILQDAPTSPFDPAAGQDGPTAAVAAFIWRNAAWLGPLALAVPVAYGALRVRRGRDLHFVGLTPGVLPAPGSTPDVERLRAEPAVAVRFTPPDRLRPGEVGALDEKRPTARHISAPLVDLAVRGHLRIHEVDGVRAFGKPDDWLLVATPQEASDRPLRDYEHRLLVALFNGRRQVRLSELRDRFGVPTQVARIQLAAGLGELFVRPLPRDLAWVTVFQVALVFLFTIGLALRGAFSPAMQLLVLVATALLAAVLVAAAVTRRARVPRTATGRALHEQSRGFRRYLATAKADQLRLEDGEDVFSRYLPYAIVYGVADRWARIFAALAEQGAPVHRPTWYVSTRGLGEIGSGLASFSTVASSSLASTPGAGGGSGSGGGGGFSGGGGGGGGGGGR